MRNLFKHIGRILNYTVASSTRPRTRQGRPVFCSADSARAQPQQGANKAVVAAPALAAFVQVVVEDFDPALKRDVAYSHVHQGWPELLDQIWVSEEFVATSRFAIGDVKRVEVFNDHLHESRERWRSDHGCVRALLRLRTA